ncbi:MAG: hypothetical protein K9G59_13730 [Caulobacter sp.]|nr:hypothetical protein [Caulobacter sp.]
MTVTDAMIIAYLDGELPTEEVAAVEAAAARDEALAIRLARHRMLSGAVKAAFADVADEPVPERLTAAVEAGRVVSLDSVRQRRITPAWGRWGTIAAGVAAGLVVGLTLPRGPAPMVDGEMRARGQLASALESQLASAPGEGEVVKVGLSFRAQDQRYCRTFTVTRGAGPAGLACREGDGWTVRMAVTQGPAGPGGDYRTAAGETPPEVLEAAQALMQGEPMDAAAEAAARARGWR